MAVSSFSCNQLIMCSLFHRFSIFKDHNMIRIADSMQSVCNHNRSLSLQQVLKCKLYLVLILNI